MVREVEKRSIPSHIAIIMDGNGRWAKKKGAARIFGHQNAMKAVEDATEYCSDSGVEYLTLYAFSKENWSRPKDEVDGLMTLLIRTLKKEMPLLQRNNVRLTSIGDVERLPEKTLQKLRESEDQTSSNTGLNLILALNYSGRWELTKAFQSMAQQCVDGDLTPSDIDPSLISDHLSTKGIPDPELLIRTSGEMRISNFLLWQIAYSEIYITDVLWPDFRKSDLDEAVSWYGTRERRFGGVSEQVN